MSKATKGAAKKAAPKKASKKATKKAAPKKKKAAVPKELGFEDAIKERKEHFTKHGFDTAHDDSQAAGEILLKAKYALTMDDRFYPGNIGNAFRDQLAGKSHRGRLNVAMSLIAAEVSRLKRAEASEKKAAKKSARKKAAKKK
jgi:hypothetical protein